MPPVLDAIFAYYKTFSTLDLVAIVDWYSEPSMTVTPNGVFSAADHVALAASLTPLVETLKAKGYGRSEFVEPQVTMLGGTAALVRGVAVRYTFAGSELERVPLSYLMRRSDTGWKIAVLVAEA